MRAQKIGGDSHIHDVRNAVTDGYFPLHHSSTQSCLIALMHAQTVCTRFSFFREPGTRLQCYCKKNDGIKDEGGRRGGGEGRKKGKIKEEKYTKFHHIHV